MARKRYRVCTGINYLPNGKGVTEKRAESGDIVDDLPPIVAALWLDQGVIAAPVSESEEADDVA